MKVPSKAAYHWRKQVVAWTKLQRQKKIISDRWRYERIWDNVSTKETESVLEVKRLWGVESVFSPATNDYGARIHKWTWRGGGLAKKLGISLNFSTRHVEIGRGVKEELSLIN